MKKFISFVLSMFLIIPCAFIFASCNSDHFNQERTYKFGGYKLMCPTQSEKNEILDGETEEGFLNNYFNDDMSTFTMIFDTKGGAKVVNNEGFEVSYEYEIDDKKIELTQNINGNEYETELEIKGNKLTQKLYNFDLIGSGLSYIEITYVRQ